MKPWLAQTFSMAARASVLKLAYCGFRSSRGTCMVGIVIAVAKRGASLIDWHPVHTSVAGRNPLPLTVALAGLVDEFQEGLMRALLIRRGRDDSQGHARRIQGTGGGALLAALRHAALPQPQRHLTTG